jgi:hypothetical protein
MAAPDSMIAGLFQDPQQYQQAQLQQQMKQNYEIAQMTPEQQVTGGLRTAGYQLGQGLGGLMGAEDPQMKLQSLRKRILQSIDRNDPKSLSEGAQALNQEGDTVGAQALIQAAQVRAKDLLEAEVKQSQITKNLKDRPASMSELSKLQAEREDIIKEFGANDPRVKEINALIAKKTTPGGIGSDIAAGLAPLVGAMAGAQAKKAGEAGGAEVGKQTANVQGKYTGGLLRKDRLANTQEFRAYIGDVVIPRLQEFGGNDSVEELKYLRSVMAGDTSMEGSAIKNILQRADKKIRSGITRLEAQNTAIQTGKPLPTGDTSAPSATPKATKRFNPQTGQLEVVK